MNRQMKWLLVSVVVLLLCLGVFLAFRAYKASRVEQETERLARWLESKVLPNNPVRIANTAGGKPQWWGYTNIHIIFGTPARKEFSMNVLIDSSLTKTKIVQLDLFMRSLPKLKAEMSTQEMGTLLFDKPAGSKVEIPVDVIYSNEPLDLQNLLPGAFVEE